MFEESAYPEHFSLISLSNCYHHTNIVTICCQYVFDTVHDSPTQWNGSRQL